MKPRVTIADYGLGNLHSVSKALAYVGCDVTLGGTPEQIAAAERVVLPGVGTFSEGMKGLSERGFVKPLQDVVASGRPLLGICLGMQFLLDESEEFGIHKGLGFISGRVVTIPASARKVPHIGWSAVVPAEGGAWSDPLFAEVAAGAPVYFVHSYQACPTDSRHLVALCSAGDHQIPAAIRSGNVRGVQFHPEKSGAVGLAMLENFSRL